MLEGKKDYYTSAFDITTIANYYNLFSNTNLAHPFELHMKVHSTAFQPTQKECAMRDHSCSTRYKVFELLPSAHVQMNMLSKGQKDGQA